MRLLKGNYEYCRSQKNDSSIPQIDYSIHRIIYRSHILFFKI